MSSGERRRTLALLAATIVLGCAHARTGAAVTAPAGGGWVVVPHVKMVAQHGDADCGPAALAIALGRWNLTPPPGTKEASDGTSAGTLRDEARLAGFASYTFEGTFDDLSNEIGAGHPVIVGLVRLERDVRTSHFAVVVGHDGTTRRWLVADPALGVLAVSRDALQDEWARAGWVTVVLAPKAEERPAAAPF